MEQLIAELSIRTEGEGFTDITNTVNKWIKESRILQGILVLTSKHTSCSLIVNENADPRVLKDLSAYMKAIVPELGFKSISGDNTAQKYLHHEEGIDDMPAHIRTTLTSTSLTMSIKASHLDLGTWQAIYLWEHRYSRKDRVIGLHSIAETIKVKEAYSENNFTSIMAKTNASKINKIIKTNNQSLSISSENELETKNDLLIDRIHDITSQTSGKPLD